ncbi:hypothetical protein ACFV6F_33615 [Kitasatospora phosalacinea]|uniref:hypothetical protein n=1 Tax=Kitasatospora phosalacinea TaxID=2065 RepID=UPI0036480858
MKAYFAMLWRFERLYLGRKVLLDENKGRHDLALTVLDAQILPHVIDYACTFNEIKTKLTDSNPADVVYDDAYCSAFKALRHSLREKADEATGQKLLRHEDRSQRDCNCSCHEVGRKSALPGTGTAS